MAPGARGRRASHRPCPGRYRRGLLADLTEAYYLDEEEDGSGFHEDGVRDHHWHGPITPLAAWYRGPFMPLFQSDLRGGVAVLNKILNHAALARARTMAGLGNPWAVPADAAGQFKTELRITGVPRVYAGDSHVWYWHRGTGVGPYPCMSALQALERYCDQLIAAGLPLGRIISLLLDGCENLAMVGLVVGLLVRHLDNAGRLLDPYLTEPAIWELEFARVVAESSGLAASSDGLAEPERRKWTFLEIAAWLVVHADADRVGQLKSVGAQLVAAASQTEGDAGGLTDDEGEGGSRAVSHVTTVRRWVGALDRDQYQFSAEDRSIRIQYVPPEDVQAVLQPGNEELQRGQEALRLVWRYVLERRPRPETAAPVTPEDLAADLETARDLLANPPTASPVAGWDAPAAVAVAALEAHILHGMSLPPDLAEFAVNTLLMIAEAVGEADQFGFQELTSSKAPTGSPLVRYRCFCYLQRRRCGPPAVRTASAGRRELPRRVPGWREPPTTRSGCTWLAVSILFGRPRAHRGCATTRSPSVSRSSRCVTPSSAAGTPPPSGAVSSGSVIQSRSPWPPSPATRCSFRGRMPPSGRSAPLPPVTHACEDEPASC